MKKGTKNPHTPEWNKKISVSHTGKKYPNRTLSKEHKENISKARKKEWLNGRRKRKWSMTAEQKENVKLSHLGRKTSDETRIKQSIAKKGVFSKEKHPNWKGGISKINSEKRKCVEYKLWREAVFKRDNYTCVWCGARSCKGEVVILNADHIKPFALFPELRFSIDNGRTLCRPCHLTTKTYGGRTK